MFSRLLRSGVLIIVLLGTVEAVALADYIEGRVKQASPSSLDMIVYDPQGRPYPNVVNLKVDWNTRKQGVRSITDLRPNDPIGAEVRQEESGLWRADSVTLFQMIDARPATKNPPPSLRDVLGNPVVKGALLGAATGAIASSASGGKAGKGALVGAGVGAAAGLLEGMFSQRSQQPAETDNQ